MKKKPEVSLEDLVRMGVPSDLVPFTIEQVTAITRISKTQIYALIGTGDFPEPFHYPSPDNKPCRRSHWMPPTIFAWIAAQAAKQISHPLVNSTDCYLHDIGRPLDTPGSTT